MLIKMHRKYGEFFFLDRLYAMFDSDAIGIPDLLNLRESERYQILMDSQWLTRTRQENRNRHLQQQPYDRNDGPIANG
jgi:hypothetical protein